MYIQIIFIHGFVGRNLVTSDFAENARLKSDEFSMENAGSRHCMGGLHGKPIAGYCIWGPTWDIP